MKELRPLVFVAALSFIETSVALPIFNHTTDGAGLFTITVDGNNEPSDLQALNIAGITGEAIDTNDEISNTASGFSIYDTSLDDLLGFIFNNDTNLIELTGSVSYGDETTETFTYSLFVDDVEPPASEPPATPSVPEPTTFLLLGSALVGFGFTMLRQRRFE